jgi:hypothetical protein
VSTFALGEANEPPDEFAQYLTYVRKLGFEETPDYDYLRSLFNKVLVKINESDDGIYDWMLVMEKQRQERELNRSKDKERRETGLAPTGVLDPETKERLLMQQAILTQRIEALQARQAAKNSEAVPNVTVTPAKLTPTATPQSGGYYSPWVNTPGPPVSASIQVLGGEGTVQLPTPANVDPSVDEKSWKAKDGDGKSNAAVASAAGVMSSTPLPPTPNPVSPQTMQPTVDRTEPSMAAVRGVSTIERTVPLTQPVPEPGFFSKMCGCCSGE